MSGGIDLRDANGCARCRPIPLRAGARVRRARRPANRGASPSPATTFPTRTSAPTPASAPTSTRSRSRAMRASGSPAGGQPSTSWPSAATPFPVSTASPSRGAAPAEHPSPSPATSSPTTIDGIRTETIPTRQLVRRSTFRGDTRSTASSRTDIIDDPRAALRPASCTSLPDPGWWRNRQEPHPRFPRPLLGERLAAFAARPPTRKTSATECRRTRPRPDFSHPARPPMSRPDSDRPEHNLFARRPAQSRPRRRLRRDPPRGARATAASQVNRRGVHSGAHGRR